MSDEEFERYKDFILEQQAKSAVNKRRIEDALARLAETMARLTQATNKLNGKQEE